MVVDNKQMKNSNLNFNFMQNFDKIFALNHWYILKVEFGNYFSPLWLLNVLSLCTWLSSRFGNFSFQFGKVTSERISSGGDTHVWTFSQLWYLTCLYFSTPRLVRRTFYFYCFDVFLLHRINFLGLSIR